MGRDRDDKKKHRDDDSDDEIPVRKQKWLAEPGLVAVGTYMQLVSGGPMLRVTATNAPDICSVVGTTKMGASFVLVNYKRQAFRRYRLV